MDENPYKSPAGTEEPVRKRPLPSWFVVAVASFCAIVVPVPVVYRFVVAWVVVILLQRLSSWLLRNDPTHRVGRALLKANRELTRIRPNPGRALEALAPYRDESAFDAVAPGSHLHGQIKGLVWAVIGDAYREAGEWSLARDWYRRAGDQTEFCAFADLFADMVVVQKMEVEYPAALDYLRRMDLLPNYSMTWLIMYLKSLCWLLPSYWQFVRRKRMVRATLEEYERSHVALG